MSYKNKKKINHDRWSYLYMNYEIFQFEQNSKISNIDLNDWFKHEDENKFNIYDYFITNKNMIILSHLISKIKLNN